jgi:hypothetical protein
LVTVELEDHGQDFLEWDIENGEVIACRPFQEGVWKGVKVHNETFEPGTILDITLPDGRRSTLKYPVVRAEQH